ncbi:MULTISPECIES: Tc toxin subunit A [Pseudomonas]|uniref:Tc toxin subunit A n=1 Tax=Pseudomonas aphyarum TaxID=2942629 RepID=A0ABT5PK24_9PSED|nr:Tc toxin subunit A [Pseudomonas aphyarum]MDD0970773.1 Tc toxin subunit A [Pseudomonas aphyarum]MDD1123827.1 Tc toxin subunit A [Pseudomonas aphyarum]
MTRSPAQIAQKMFTQAVGKPKRSSTTALTRFFKAGGSVTVLAQKGVDGLMHDFGLDRQQAVEFQQRLNVLSTVVLRQFIEHQLTARDARVVARTGLNNGPTYALLFKPNFDNLCPPDAIEAIHSPAAYLTDLLHWALHRLGTTDGKDFPLVDRRTDLEKLLIDVKSVHGAVSSVEVISRIMEHFITSTLGSIQNLDEALNQKAFPRELPFHWPWVTLDHVLKGQGESVGSVVRLCDLQYPYFLRSAPWSDKSDDALVQAARLSSSQRRILTQAPHFPDGADEFYQKYLGLKDISVGNLRLVSVFNERTKLSTLALEALLSIEGSTPFLSENAPDFVAGSVTGKDHGSVFIHEAKAPPITIVNSGLELLNRFEDMEPDRVDRANRIVRLTDWLRLASHETDRLIVAAMLAEVPSPPPSRYWITANTLRALGLFQELRELFGCTAEDFAAFIGPLCVFGRGTERAQYDRIFNSGAASSRPLVLDDRSFPVVPVTAADLLTVKQLCAGLGIDLETYFYLATLIAAAHGLTELKCSLPIVSSFYRMVRLPRLLGITPIEAVLLLNLKGGQVWVNTLAGVPQINNQQSADNPDVLSVMHALMDCVQWAQTVQLPMHWVVQQATVWPPNRPDERQLSLFDQWRRQAPVAQVTEDVLKMAGIEPLSNNRQWLRALAALVDEQGLIRDFAESADQTYEAHAREMTERAVVSETGSLDTGLVELILAVVLRCRASQNSMVQEGLAAYSGLNPDLVLQVLGWSGANVHFVLAQVLALPEAFTDSGTVLRREDPPSDPVLQVMAEFSRRSAVVARLELGREFLNHFIATGYRQWFGLNSVDAFDLSTLYYLTVYKRALGMSDQPETRLVDYLRRINALPANLANHGLELVQERAAKWLAELFNWSVDEVRICSTHVNPSKGLVVTLQQLDVLTRIRLLAKKTGQSARTLLELGTLPPDSEYADYEHVADLVRASLTTTTEPTYADDVIAGGLDLVVRWTTVPDPVRLIANKPDEFAEFTVTVENREGQARLNVNVHCATTLGRFEPSMITTGGDGTATVKFFPGSRMGSVTPTFRLDLGEETAAPRIEIGPDMASLHLKSPNPFPVPDSTVLIGTPVTYRAIVQDAYDNPIADALVAWILNPPTKGVIKTVTDQQGRTELTFTRGEPITVKVKATAENSTTVTFRDVTFVEALPAHRRVPAPRKQRKQ